MTLEISELMDGELQGSAAASLISRIGRDPRSREDWAAYHLIGDTMRQAAFFSPGLAAGVAERLAREPVVFAPRRRGAAPGKLVRWGLSLAASLAAVAVVAWVGLHTAPETAPPQVAAVKPAAAPALQPAQAMTSPVNDYLVAHQEYSPRSSMQGVAPSVQNVSYPAEGASR